MDIQNHFYGHSAALALAAGLRRPRHIQGILQHGWTTASPALVLAHDFPHVGVDPRWPVLAWSHSSRGWSPETETRRSVAVGSPFLYLAREARAAGWAPSSSGRSLWIPFHGTRLVKVRGDHAALARQAFEREGAATVCLHVEDADDPAIVSAWSDAGHELVTAGPRRDPDFLARILDLVGSARRVVSNRLSTAVMYAAAVGKEVAVYGPPLAFTGDEVHSVDQIRDMWPEFHGETTVTDVTTASAEAELGAAHLLAPAQLRAALGWDSPLSARSASYYWFGSSVRKAAAALGVTGRTDAESFTVSSVTPRAFLRHPLSHLPAPLPRRLPSVPDLAAPIRVPGRTAER